MAVLGRKRGLGQRRGTGFRVAVFLGVLCAGLPVVASPEAETHFRLAETRLSEARACSLLEPDCPDRMRRHAGEAVAELVRAYDRGERSERLVETLDEALAMFTIFNHDPEADERALGERALAIARAPAPVPDSGEEASDFWGRRASIMLHAARLEGDEQKRATIYSDFHRLIETALPSASGEDRNALHLAQAIACKEEGFRTSDPVLRAQRYGRADSLFASFANEMGEDEEGDRGSPPDALRMVVFRYWGQLAIAQAGDLPDPAARGPLLDAAEHRFARSQTRSLFHDAEIAALRGDERKALEHLRAFSREPRLFDPKGTASMLRRTLSFAAFRETQDFRDIIAAIERRQ